MNTALIVSIIICVILSAYFSATETAFSSMNRIRVKNIAKNGNKKAELVMELSENYDKLLSTILIGNNIVNIASASLATTVFTFYFGSMGVTLSTVVMTVVVLIFGEISPKSLAKESPEAFAMFSAPAIRFLMIVFSPLVWFFSQWKKLLNKLFKTRGDDAFSEEELITIVEEAEQGGAFDEHESELIRSAIEFNDLEAGEILTSRVNMVAVEKTAQIEDVKDVFRSSGYSRIPVYEDNIDNIVGVLHEKDFYDMLYRGKSNITGVVKPVIWVSPGTEISDLLRRLQKEKMHMAVVVDEFGGTMGIVTMEDIIEELVGEIWDEHDEVVANFKPLDNGDFLVDANCEIENFFDYFELQADPEEYDAKTVSGWVTGELGHIPVSGETFDFEDICVTVTNADERRVLEVQVHKQPIEVEVAKSAE